MEIATGPSREDVSANEHSSHLLHLNFAMESGPDNVCNYEVAEKHSAFHCCVHDPACSLTGNHDDGMGDGHDRDHAH